MTAIFFDFLELAGEFWDVLRAPSLDVATDPEQFSPKEARGILAGIFWLDVLKQMFIVAPAFLADSDFAAFKALLELIVPTVVFYSVLWHVTVKTPQNVPPIVMVLFGWLLVLAAVLSVFNSAYDLYLIEQRTLMNVLPFIVTLFPDFQKVTFGFFMQALGGKLLESYVKAAKAEGKPQTEEGKNKGDEREETEVRGRDAGNVPVFRRRVDSPGARAATETD